MPEQHAPAGPGPAPIKPAPEKPAAGPARKPHTPLAYERMDFLQSPPARTLRILAEYLEPQFRFRQERVHDTVVFFGSARFFSREEATKTLEAARRRVKNSPGREARAKLEEARRDVAMSRYYEDARELARLLTQWSLSLPHQKARFVVCSGGGPGIMEAANRGACEARGRSVGLSITLPMEPEHNSYMTAALDFHFHYFFMRKYWFVYLAKALIVFPGGFGTLDELFEILTLVQTRKIRKKMVVLIYGSQYWRRVINFPEMVRAGVISPEDLKLFQFADTPQAAFRLVKTGILGETEVEILDGLKEGDEIVTGSYKTLRTLKDGAILKVE